MQRGGADRAPGGAAQGEGGEEEEEVAMGSIEPGG